MPGIVRIMLGNAMRRLTSIGCVMSLAACSSVDVQPGHAQTDDKLPGQQPTEMSPLADAGAGQDDASAPSGPQVDTKHGRVTGKQVGSTREFLGIPYGKAQRFLPPTAADDWSDPRDATQFGPACPQAKNSLADVPMQSEDCLTVNVYTPADVSGPLPVLVFLHGGAFVMGASSQYDGQRLSELGVVVVTLNYRLGALGFLSLPALDDMRAGVPSGSDGIRDQQLALHWVQDDIAAFGGDAHNVTLVGESAGAISACIHMLSPGSRGLAARFMLESGTCTVDGLGPAYKPDANALGQQLADGLCSGQSDVLACLRGKTADELVNWGLGLGVYGANWLPTVEGQGGVLPDTPDRLFGLVDSLAPLIIGTNKNEWGFFEQTGYMSPRTAADYRALVMREFGSSGERVLEQYPAASDAEANDVYVRMLSDASFRCPALVVAKLASQRGAPVWMYSFDQGAATHAQELDYVFGGAGNAPQLQGAMQRYWTQFAKRGDPNDDRDPMWPQFHVSDPKSLQLIDPPHAQSAVSDDICMFWRNLFLNGATVQLF